MPDRTSLLTTCHGEFFSSVEIEASRHANPRVPHNMIQSGVCLSVVDTDRFEGKPGHIPAYSHYTMYSTDTDLMYPRVIVRALAHVAYYLTCKMMSKRFDLGRFPIHTIQTRSEFLIMAIHVHHERVSKPIC